MPQVKLDIQDIVRLVSQLELKDLDDFIKRITAVRETKTHVDGNSRKDFLKEAVKIDLEKKERQRLFDLNEKLEDATISEGERKEYLAIVSKAREINVQRMKHLAELSDLTGKSLSDLMKELKLVSAGNA
jgi:ribosomal protein L12E/L44/L45/RPP1/RPP2